MILTVLKIDANRFDAFKKSLIHGIGQTFFLKNDISFHGFRRNQPKRLTGS